MGLRYRKSIRLGGGVRINLSGRGVGWSVGGKGVRYTKPAGGRRSYRTASIPGTGVSYRSTTGQRPSSHPQAPAGPRRPWGRWLLLGLGVLLIAAIPVVGPWLFWTVVVGLLLLWFLRRQRAAGSRTRVPPTWTPPSSAPPAGPPPHQAGLADTEHDAQARRHKADELRRQLDDLG